MLLRAKHFFRTLSKETGNAMMEMLLFSPIAFLFLFGVVDGGFAYLERSAIADAIKSGLNSEQISWDGENYLNSDSQTLNIEDDHSLSLNTESTQRIIHNIGEQIRKNIETRSALSNLITEKLFLIKVTPVLLSIDPETGSLTNYEVLSTSYQHPTPATFNIQSSVPSFNYIDAQTYLKEMLPENSEASSYAIPIGRAYEVTNSFNPTSRYLDQAVVAYVEVTALTRGIGRDHVKSIIGRFYALEEQYLLPIRAQLG
jgi:TadE-like protein